MRTIRYAVAALVLAGISNLGAARAEDALTAEREKMHRFEDLNILASNLERFAEVYKQVRASDNPPDALIAKCLKAIQTIKALDEGAVPANLAQAPAPNAGQVPAQPAAAPVVANVAGASVTLTKDTIRPIFEEAGRVLRQKVKDHELAQKELTQVEAGVTIHQRRCEAARTKRRLYEVEANNARSQQYYDDHKRNLQWEDRGKRYAETTANKEANLATLDEEIRAESAQVAEFKSKIGPATQKVKNAENERAVAQQRFDQVKVQFEQFFPKEKREEVRKYPLYVLKDGRKISCVMKAKMGDTLIIKDEQGKSHNIKEEDIEFIDK